jgi:glycosyltransferase involved in cell wall biosynthesis
MHILLIHQAFAALDEAGGTRHHEMARHLVHQGHQVTIIASPVSYLTGTTHQPKTRWVDRQEDIPGLTILRAYTYAALHRSFVHRVFSFLSFMISSFLIGLSVRRVDLVWGTSPPIFQGVTAWLLARLKRAPFLFEVRDLWPAFAIAVGVLKNKTLIAATEWLEQFLYRRADRVVVNSPGFTAHVRQRGARQVHLIPNGADPDMFVQSEEPSPFRQKHGLVSQFLVVYAGAHGMSNDLTIILQTAAQLQDRKDIHFVLIGDGKEKSALIAQAETLRLNNLTFIPPAPKVQMAEILSTADAGVAILKPIELYKTTYPNKVFDYMAAGCPVILAIDGVIRQVVEEAQAGIFVPPGQPEPMAEAIRSLASDPGRCRHMGQAGQTYIRQHFDRARLAAEFANLLAEMRHSNG